jgi:hypothetical protein
VAVTFSMTSTGLSRVQRNNSSSGSLAAAAAAGNTIGGGAAAGGGVDAAAVKPGSKADQSLPAISTGKVVQAPGAQQQQQGGGSALPAGGSPVKGSKVVGRAYSEVQFVPAHCAWGFPDFTAAAGGWEGLKGPDGKVCLRCQLQHRE